MSDKPVTLKSQLERRESALRKLVEEGFLVRQSSLIENMQRPIWQPHTCNCRLSLTLEETEAIGNDTLKLREYVDNELVRSSSNTALAVGPDDEPYFVVRKRRTVKLDQEGNVVMDVFHQMGDDIPPEGGRLRAHIVKACDEHHETSEPIQGNFMRTYPKCGCEFHELWFGARSKERRFGYRVVSICWPHAKRWLDKEYSYAGLRDVAVRDAKLLVRAHGWLRGLASRVTHQLRVLGQRG